MKITIESTSKIVTLIVKGGEIPARIWEGTTDDGVPVHCYITRIAVPESAAPYQHQRFARELVSVRSPSPEVAAIDPRLIL
jgi:hypothetical protein